MTYLFGESTEWISVFHQNLEECRTSELGDPKNDRIQRLVASLLKISQGQTPDIGSLNEIEYDLKHVPSDQYSTMGTNVTRFLQRITDTRWWSSICFAHGNCGMDGRAKQVGGTGAYLNERNAPAAKKLEYGDPVNCLATLPGQYGVGFWSKYKCRLVHLVSNLAWKDFNPSADPTQYKDATGKPLPEDTPLFDKALLLMQVDISGTKVYFVALHAMPAFDFGQEGSANVPRNGDQLAFLEWLLTGKTYFNVPPTIQADSGEPVHPLPLDARVLAMGDLNADYRHRDIPGAARLRSLIQSHNFFPNGETTERSVRPDGSTLELQLDYFLWRGLDLIPDSARIGPIDPENLSDHGALFARFAIPVAKEAPSTWEWVRDYAASWWS